jgi:myb proto-oncogene protein
LKKRLKQNQANTEIILQSTTSDSKSPRQSESSDLDILPSSHQACASMSPQPSSSEFSSLTDASVTVNNISHIKIDDMDLSESFPELDESIWSEPPLVETTSWSDPPLVETTSNNMPSDLLTVSADDQSQAQSQFNPIEIVDLGCNYDSILDDDMDFWYNLFIKAGGSAELAEF